MNPVRSPHRRRIAAAALLMAAALAWILIAATRGRGFDWQLFTSTVRSLDWAWLGLAAACAYGTYLIRALRWAVLLRPLRPQPRFRKLVSATVIGYSAVTALGRPAEMVRPYLIAMAESVPFSSQVAAWVVERLYDTIIALAVFGFALSQAGGAVEYVGPALGWALRLGGWIIGVGATVSFAVLLALKYRSEHMRRGILRVLGFLRESHFRRVECAIGGFVDGARCARSSSGMFLLTGYTLAEWLLIAACYACVLRAFGDVVALSPTDVLVLMGFVSFGSLVQLPAVGGGAQVTAVLVLTEVFGVPVEAAASIAMLLWFMSFMAILPAGVLLAIREGVTWARLREFERGAGS